MFNPINNQTGNLSCISESQSDKSIFFRREQLGYEVLLIHNSFVLLIQKIWATYFCKIYKILGHHFSDNQFGVRKKTTRKIYRLPLFFFLDTAYNIYDNEAVNDLN